jgi:hypothetical protein
MLSGFKAFCCEATVALAGEGVRAQVCVDRVRLRTRADVSPRTVRAKALGRAVRI